MLNEENYFSDENQIKYCGSSQIKTFMECESRGLAELNGDYIRPISDALLCGSYFDSMFEGNKELFEAQNQKELFSKNRKPYAAAEKIIKCYERSCKDKVFYNLCAGEQQSIMTGSIQGVPVKIKIDSLHKDMIVDRKTAADFKEKWKDGEYQPWWKVWRYDIQAAIYTEIYEQNTGVRLPFVLAAITKEVEPDMRICKFTEETLKNAIGEVRSVIERIQDVKQSKIEPKSCGVCNWCKSQKKFCVGEFEEI